MIEYFTNGKYIVKAYQLTGDRASDNLNAEIFVLHGLLRGWEWKGIHLFVTEYQHDLKKEIIVACANSKNKDWIIKRKSETRSIDGKVYCLNNESFIKSYKNSTMEEYEHSKKTNKKESLCASIKVYLDIKVS